MKSKVKYLKNIQVAKNLKGEDELAVKARGIAELKMRISPVLVPKDYETEPADGIYELDFLLDESNEAYTNIDMEVEVVLYFRNLPSWVRGIKINARENSDIELL